MFAKSSRDRKLKVIIFCFQIWLYGRLGRSTEALDEQLTAYQEKQYTSLQQNAQGYETIQ